MRLQTRQELLIGALAVVVIIVGIHFAAQQGIAAPTSQRSAPSIPPITSAEQQILTTSHGFAALVSYTDRGFEPASLSVKKGNTIRFTDNSSRDLWISAVGSATGQVYPGTGDNCGQSAFDSCVALKPGEFWEFTFTVAGTWSYRNNLNTHDTGVVRVK